MASKYKATEKTAKKSTDIDLSAVNKAMDNSVVKFKLNGVSLSAPKKYMGDNTAIAGKINAQGRIRFSRCQKDNVGNYARTETEHGILSFGEGFRSALSALVK